MPGFARMRQPRVLGLGDPLGSAFGQAGITKRLGALAKHTPLSGDRLLDIGCAAGLYTERLAESFREVHAFDVEPDRLRSFRDRVRGTAAGERIKISQMSVHDMGYPDATFDVVTAIEVLEHVPDLDSGLREIHRVLRPGGRFLITGPNRYFPLETHGVLIRGRRHSPGVLPGLPWVPPLHRKLSDARSFTVRSLTRLIGPYGFELRAHDYIMPPFDRSAWGKRIKPLTDGLERTPLRVFGITLIMVFVRA
jgi:SAM-dependent methyltransferase